MSIILTIIVPAYNMEKYLRRCLSSLLINHSLNSDFEVLVINDGSKDKTSEIAHEFEWKYPDTFRTIDKENGHYGSCINRGLQEAKGTFVKVLDADDSFDKEAFSSFINFIKRRDISSKADVVLSDFYEDSPTGRSHQVVFSPHKGIFPIEGLSASDKQRWFIHGLTFRTELLRQIHYSQTEGVSYTDLEWAFIPLGHVRHLAHCDASFYRYSVGREDQSISDTTHAKNLWMETGIVEHLVDHFSSIKNQLRKENYTFLSDRLFIMVSHLYELYLISLKKWVAADQIDQLVLFDKSLHKKDPELYAKLETHSATIGKIPFCFISHWRHHRHFMMWIQGTLYSIANLYAKIKKNITESLYYPSKCFL